MKRSGNELIVHGVVGGVLAGLVVALWFLVVDTLVWQRPFLTPALVASALYNIPFDHPTVRLVAMYSIVHFGVFAILGICAAAAVAALHTTPRLLLGLFFGIVVQEVLFYTGLFLSGLSPSGLIPWQHVIGANVLSGLVLMAYLHHAEHSATPLGLGVLKGHPQVTRGLITGLIGAGVVAVWFFILDILEGAPFVTPAALGSALLFGSSAATAALNLGVVAAYTVVHIVAFVVAGMLFVLIAEQVERTPGMLLLAVMTAIVLDAVVVTALATSAQWVLGSLGMWSVIVGNLLAVVAMGTYVWQTHPTLRYKLKMEALQVRV